MSNIDTYLKTATPTQKETLERIRKIIKQMVPDAVEAISYGVPTFKLNEQPVIYFAAYKGHMSIYPATDDMIKDLGEAVAKFRTSKGTLQFTEQNLIPEPLIKKIIKHRLSSIVKS